MKTLGTAFSLAWNFLTIIPLPWSRQSDVQPQMLALSFGWYPFVGFLIGTVLVLSDRALLSIFSVPVATMLSIIILIAVTGAIHQDGLADAIDGLAGGYNPQQRLAIMRDSHIGAIGATGLILAIGLRYVGLVGVPSMARETVLLCMPALGRWSMVVGAWNVSYPRSEGGMAAAFIQHLSYREIFLATGLLGIGLFWAMPPLPAIGLLLSALVIVRLVAWMAGCRFGGVTGDVLGAMNEVVEVAFLLSVPVLVSFS